MEESTSRAWGGSANPARDARAAPLTIGRKLGYAIGGLVDGTAMQSLNVFLLFYVTTVVGLSGSLAGLAIAVGLIVDAIADPLIGSRSDKLRSRLGRRLPFMVAGLPLIMLTLVMMFSLPTRLSAIALFGWLTLLSVAHRISLSVFLLPHQALGAEISDNYNERSTIMALRWAMFMTGGLASLMLGFGLFFSGDGGLTRRAAYLPFSITLAGLIAFGGIAASLSALGTRTREHCAGDDKASMFLIFHDLVEVFRNRSFRTLFAGTALFFIGFGIHNVLALHANTFFWQLPPARVQLVTMVLFLGLLLGAPLAAPLLARAEKRTVLLIGITVLLLVQGLPALLRILGWFPFKGDELVAVLAIFALLMGVMTGCVGIAGASAMADAADEHEFLFGKRREGLYFAALSFANKAATAIGSLVAGLVLQGIGFSARDASHAGAATIISPHAANVIGLAYGPGAALLSVAAVVVTWSYRLDRDRHGIIITAMVDRRTPLKDDSIRSAAVGMPDYKHL